MGDPLVEVGRRLRAYRKLKQLTQEELAQALGVSLNVVGSIERGRRPIPKDLYADLERILQVRHEVLLGEADD